MSFESDNERLIERLKSYSDIKSKAVENAFRNTPRHLFVPESLQHDSYKDVPLGIGNMQTISQPTTVAVMTEALEVKSGQKILEIGTGSGWQATILSRLVGKKGRVYSIERIKELARFANRNIEKLKIKNIHISIGDGSLGLKVHAPFDRIIVTAACPEVPEPFLHQLKPSGVIVMPLGNKDYQEVYIIKKLKRGIKKLSLGYFAFVPLIGKYGFKD